MIALAAFAALVAFTVGLTGEMGAVDRVARAWERYARERGHRFRGAGALKSSLTLAVTASLGDVEVTLELRGSDARRTRASARVGRALPPRVADYHRAMDEELALALDLLRARREVSFSYAAGSIELSWSGAEEDPAILDAALRAVASACHWHGAGGVYR
jgi:hypothetical protein